MNEFRNNLVHNYRPHQVDSGFRRRKKSDGSAEIIMDVGKYTTSSEFVKNIEDSIDLLADVTNEIRMKILL